MERLKITMYHRKRLVKLELFRKTRKFCRGILEIKQMFYLVARIDEHKTGRETEKVKSVVFYKWVLPVVTVNKYLQNIFITQKESSSNCFLIEVLH